ncbi:MAG: Ig domain-containing protein [Clostridia bacterium]|nr:Ig domain-containing protein [Clostridia bacterium]
MKKSLLCFLAVVCLVAMFATTLVACKPDNQDPPTPPEPEKIAVTGVSLDKTAVSLLVNETAQLKATVAPADADNKRVTWTSSDNNVAEVSVTGVVTAKANGTATITAKTADGGFTATCTVTVSSIEVTGIDISATSASLNLGEQLVLAVELLPENASNKNVMWTTSNESVAIVNNGVVTALKAGEAVITATSVSGNLRVNCTVTVSGQGIDYSTYTHIKTVEDYKKIVPGNGKYCLDNDIDFGGENVGCIGNSGEYTEKTFTGVFDGRGYSIKNAYFVSNGKDSETGENNNTNCAMFYKVHSGGVVRNVNFVDCVSEGVVYNAIVAVWLEGGTIENCYIQGHVANNNEYWDGWTLGGMIACVIKVENGVSAKIRNCIVYGTSAGSTYGLVGSNYTESPTHRAVENCYMITAMDGTPMNMVGDISAEWSGGAQPIFDCYSITAEEALVADTFKVLNPYYWVVEDGRVPYLRTEEGIVRDHQGYELKIIVIVDATKEISLGSGQKKLSVEFKPAGQEVSLNWASSDETVVKVDNAGILTPVSTGTATITITTSDGYTATCIVTVVD